jgi:hypothetical protein
MLIFHVRTAEGYVCGINQPKNSIGREWAISSINDPSLCPDCAAILKQELSSLNMGALVTVP